MIRAGLAALALAGCHGPRIYDCPEAEVRSGFAAVLAEYPEVGPFLDRLDFVCKPYNPLPEAECVTWGYGTGPIPGQRAEVVVNVEYALECSVHEPYHAALHAHGDGCPSHSEECGWSADSLEAMVAAARYDTE